MKSGEISGNKSARHGGGISIEDEKGTFTMENGKISGNTASRGSGVFVSAGTFTMEDRARVSSDNTVCLSSSGAIYRSVTIGGDFTGPAGPVAKIDLFRESDPASNWSGKAILKLTDSYSGSLAVLKDRFILGNFIHQEGEKSPYTYPATPIQGYEIGSDGTLEASGR
jgi:hypothetical protein